MVIQNGTHNTAAERTNELDLLVRWACSRTGEWIERRAKLALLESRPRGKALAVKQSPRGKAQKLGAET